MSSVFSAATQTPSPDFPSELSGITGPNELKPNDDGSIATDDRPESKASHQAETEVENVKFKLDAEARALGLVDVEIFLKSATIGDISLSVVYNVEIEGKEKRCMLTIYGISKTELKDRLKRGRLGTLTAEQRAWIGSHIVPETEPSPKSMDANND